MEYSQYIKTNHWKTLRERFINSRRFTGECFVCGKSLDKKYAIIHHKTYKYIWKEKLQNLVAICRTCHQEVHYEKGIRLPLTKETLNQRVYKLRTGKRQLPVLNLIEVAQARQGVCRQLAS